MPRILQDVVPGEGLRAGVVLDRCRQDRLLDHEGGAAIPAHPVRHAEEGRDRERHEVVEEGEGDPADGGRDCEQHQRATSSEPVAAERDQQRRHRTTREPRRDDDADVRRIERQRRQVQPQQHADHTDAERPHERGREEESAVGHPPRGS